MSGTSSIENPAYMAGMQGDDPSVSAADLVSAYESGIADLQQAVAGMTAEQAKARPIPGKWSTVECVAHLAGTEIYFSDRIERTIAIDRPLLVSTDERPYPDRIGFQELDLAEEVALLTALRKHVARVLKRQPPEAWKRTAVHTESGILTLRQLVFQAVRHLRHHLPFIAEKRNALKA
jgi:DinB superfamily